MNDVYGTGIDNDVSRLTYLTDDHATLESYLYLGLSTVVEMDHPETGVNLTYISQDDTTGDAGDQYTGLDRFGRVVEQNWSNRHEFVGVRRAIRLRPRRQRAVPPGQRELRDERALRLRQPRATHFLSSVAGCNNSDTAITGTPSVDETWTYDPLGNRTTDTVGLTTTTRPADFPTRSRASSGATTPTYDANGNMTTDQTRLGFH